MRIASSGRYHSLVCPKMGNCNSKLLHWWLNYKFQLVVFVVVVIPIVWSLSMSMIDVQFVVLLVVIVLTFSLFHCCCSILRVKFRFVIVVVVIIRAVVRSDAFYRTTVRRFCVLRMWDVVLTRSLSRHHFVKGLVRLVKWGEPLVHQNTAKSTQDGHCPGSSVANLRFARGVWRGSVLRHHSFSAHVRRVRARETPGGWFWWLLLMAPPVCFCFRLFRTSLPFWFPSAQKPSLRFDGRANPKAAQPPSVGLCRIWY